MTTIADNTAALQDALATCSFDRLRTLYRDVGKLVKMTLGLTPKQLVTETEMDADCDAARKKMEAHLGALTVKQLNKTYRKKIHRQIKSMGGMKIIGVDGKGAKAFAYTCGFTEVGGKELLLQNVHRSTTKHVGRMLNYLHQRHNGGHPLGHGHTIADGSGNVYVVMAPDNVESILLKASKTLEPTRLYGLKGYDLLLLVPVGSRSESEEDKTKQATREEALRLAVGLEVNGFQPKQEGAKPLQMCGWCRATKTKTDARAALWKCSGCKNAFYCCPEHQKLDWKNHKVFCRRSKEESLQIAMNPFLGKK
jgi:hypothetical protein